MLMSCSNYKRKISRKLHSYWGHYKCFGQKDSTAILGQNTVTLFFDFEGSYARGEQTKPCLQAVYYMLDILNSWNTQATFNTVALLQKDCPSLVNELHTLGHEVASHTYDHTMLEGLSKKDIYKNLQRAKQLFTENNLEIIGHRSPQSVWDWRLLDVLLDLNFKWTAENGCEPYPYIIKQNNDAVLWRFPIHCDDYRYICDELPPDEMLSQWKGIVQRNFSSAFSYTAIGFHPWIEATPERLTIFKEFVEWLCSQKDIKVMNFGQSLAKITQTDSAAI